MWLQHINILPLTPIQQSCFLTRTCCSEIATHLNSVLIFINCQAFCYKGQIKCFTSWARYLGLQSDIFFSRKCKYSVFASNAQRRGGAADAITSYYGFVNISDKSGSHNSLWRCKNYTQLPCSTDLLDKCSLRCIHLIWAGHLRLQAVQRQQITGSTCSRSLEQQQQKFCIATLWSTWVTAGTGTATPVLAVDFQCGNEIYGC